MPRLLVCARRGSSTKRSTAARSLGSTVIRSGSRHQRGKARRQRGALAGDRLHGIGELRRVRGGEHDARRRAGSARSASCARRRRRRRCAGRADSRSPPSRAGCSRRPRPRSTRCGNEVRAHRAPAPRRGRIGRLWRKPPILPRTKAASRPQASNRKRSKLEETWMSMDGEVVATTSRSVVHARCSSARWQDVVLVGGDHQPLDRAAPCALAQ